jgi:hypothetical protein
MGLFSLTTGSPLTINMGEYFKKHTPRSAKKKYDKRIHNHNKTPIKISF